MADVIQELQQNLNNKIKLNEPLSAHTNFKIGGPAKFYFEAETSEELTRAVQVANELTLSFILLGGGANVLVSDNGFSGLVIVAKNNQWSIEGETVRAEAGVNLAFLVQQTIEAGLTGLEPLVAIPGSVGGAVYGNAGLPQVEGGCIGDWVEEVQALSVDKIINLSREQCQFFYRQSIFKQTKDVILEAKLKLNRGDKVESQKLIKKYIEARKNQPYDKPSSGCVFANVEVKDDTQKDELRRKITGEEKLEGFLIKGQIPAGWLIELSDCKGKKIGGAQISEKHANYIINVGDATAENVIMLISYVKQQVRDKFGVELHEEVQYLGF